MWKNTGWLSNVTYPVPVKKHRHYLMSSKIFHLFLRVNYDCLDLRKTNSSPLSDVVFLSLDMMLEVNSEALLLLYPSLAVRSLRGEPSWRMIDCLYLTPYQGWEKHFGARVILICHFQIPSSSLLRITHSLFWFQKQGEGNCENTKTDVNELRGSHQEG